MNLHPTPYTPPSLVKDSDARGARESVTSGQLVGGITALLGYLGLGLFILWSAAFWSRFLEVKSVTRQGEKLAVELHFKKRLDWSSYSPFQLELVSASGDPYVWHDAEWPELVAGETSKRLTLEPPDAPGTYTFLISPKAELLERVARDGKITVRAHWGNERFRGAVYDVK